MAETYAPLVHHTLPRDARLHRRTDAEAFARVTAASPALQVMTDLQQVDAVRVAPSASIDAALERMKIAGVRLLFVTGPDDGLLGVITARDIEGEKTVRMQHDLGVTRADVLVRDIMTARESIEVLLLDDVERARVGDIVATLRAIGRQHALVVDPRGGATRVRGMFSTSRIGRQLGATLEVGETAHGFAEIGAALRG
jgi:CBS domain containing-hemolysin-like protein